MGWTGWTLDGPCPPVLLGHGLEERGAGGWDKKVCVPKMARPDFPNGKFRLSHDCHFGLGVGGGPGGGGRTPPPPVVYGHSDTSLRRGGGAYGNRGPPPPNPLLSKNTYTRTSRRTPFLTSFPGSYRRCLRSLPTHKSVGQDGLRGRSWVTAGHLSGSGGPTDGGSWRHPP